MARVEPGMLCNAASIEQSGLVSMLGAMVDTVSGPVLPVRHTIWIVIRIVWDDGEYGAPHDLRVSLISPSGATLASIQGLGLAPPAEAAEYLPAASVFAAPILFETHDVGMHRVECAVDDKIVWQTALRVRVELPPLS